MIETYSPVEKSVNKILGNWNLNCNLFCNEAKLNGKLQVSKDEITFQTKQTDDYSSILEIISKALIGKNTPQHNIAINIYRQWLKNNTFVIPKSEIQSISKVSSIFKKQVVLSLSDSSTVVFNNGFSGINQLYNAISN